MAVAETTSSTPPKALHRGARWASVILAAALAAACTVRADENEVVIEHLAEHPGPAQMKADVHCRKFGKEARRVQMEAPHPTFLWLRARTSVFECVDADAGTGAAPRGKAR